MSVLEADQSISARKLPRGILQKMKNGKNGNVLTGLFLSSKMTSFFSPASQKYDFEHCNAEGHQWCEFELVSHRLTTGCYGEQSSVEKPVKLLEVVKELQILKLPSIALGCR